MARVLILLVVTVLGATSRTAGAGEPGVPPGALAWWRFDPSAFPEAPGAPGSDREVLVATLRAALASGALGERTGAMLGALLLVGLDAGDAPHTLALLDFQASRPPGGSGMDLHSLQVVMRIESATRHADLLRTLKAIGIDGFTKDANAAPPGVQARIPLPDGRVGVAFRREDWESWRELSWCSEPDAFTIGVGHDALDAWFAGSDSPEPDRAPWADLRAPIDAARAPGPVVFECYIDFDALRARFPAAFFSGRTPRMFAALELESASALLFQARVADAVLPDARPIRLMAIDAVVRDRDGTIERRPLSHDAWPQGVSPTLVPAGATSATVATVEWPRAFELVLAMHTATVPDRKLKEFEAKRDAWLAKHTPEVDAALSELGSALVITTHDRIPAPLPGVGCVSIPAREGSTVGRLAARIERAIETFHPAVRTDVQKAPSPVWSMRVDRTGLVRLPWWTVTRIPGGPPVVVGAWAAAPLETARRWLGGEAPP